MQHNKAISSTDQAIAGAVRAEMARRKVSQQSLWQITNEQAGWSRSALNRRVQGGVPFSLGEIALIAKAIDADPAAIIHTALTSDLAAAA